MSTLFLYVIGGEVPYPGNEGEGTTVLFHYITRWRFTKNEGKE
jgi:tagatose-1,6-bisphosphate aldolase non-catalytic subunit AgaZ/GatZ